MRNTNMRQGFTMIELIFVIVIIGILAAVAIPKLAANRTDAQASVCVHEAGQFLSEITTTYTKDGYTTFLPKTASDMTNILTGAAVAGINNITDTAITTTGAVYSCDGIGIVDYTGAVIAGGDYNLTVTVTTPAVTASPAAQKAAAQLIANGLGTNAGKDYSL